MTLNFRTPERPTSHSYSRSLLSLGAVVLTLFLFETSWAKGGGGGHSLGLGASLVSSSQKSINEMKDAANSATNGPVSTPSLSSAYEFFAQYSYRFSGTMFAVAFRPGLFTQSATGTGDDGAYNYKLNGLTLFSLLRIVPLENAFMKFFLQAGIGYGKLSADITTGSGNSLKFDGDNFGSQAGLGADFCFTPEHCVTIEGNIRYLPVERNIASSVSGTPVGVDSVATGGEVEKNAKDLGTTMSGIQGVIAYTMNF